MGFLRRLQRGAGAGPDSGSALVAAVGVALVGTALTTLVVTQAILVSTSAGRDRIRTIEVHAAEAVLDATLSRLTESAVCGEALTPVTYGTGATAVVTTVDITYWDASDTELPCVDGVASGAPVLAQITSTSTPVNDAPGTTPERSFRSTVNLYPILEESPGTALFAGSSLNGVNSGHLHPSEDGQPATVWIDSGDFTCSNSYEVEGDLIVADGGITMSNTCSISGNAWSRDDFSSSNSPSGYRVGGDVTVFDGDLSVGNATSFGGDLSIGGDITGWFFQWTTVEGNICSDNVGTPCGALPEFTSRGLPEVHYDPDAWDGFVVRTEEHWADDIVNSTGLSGWRATNVRNNPCRIDNTVKSPIEANGEDTIYDLRTCDLQFSNTQTLRLFADTAFFVNSLTISNKFLFESGDGEDHQVWFIVPTGGTGSIQFSNQTTVGDGISNFLYTPNQVRISNNQDFTGQIYADNIQVSNNFNFWYEGMGIPGVDLGGGAPTAGEGFSVEIINKHETR